MKKNNKGYVLMELVISMSIIFVIILQFVTLTLDMYSKNVELARENNLENNIYNLYKEIGYDFINYNIQTISGNANNGYTITYYRVNPDDEEDIHVKKLNFSNNTIIYSEDAWNGKNIYTYSLESDKDIKINSNNSNIELTNDTSSGLKTLKLTLNINNEDYEFVCANKLPGVIS